MTMSTSSTSLRKGIATRRTARRSAWACSHGTRFSSPSNPSNRTWSVTAQSDKRNGPHGAAREHLESACEEKPHDEITRAALVLDSVVVGPRIDRDNIGQTAK